MRHRIGHRGAFLLCIAVYDLFFGLYLAEGGSIQHVPLIGERPWGWIWLAAGMFLICGAFTHRDAAFFTTAVLVKMVWALEYFRLDYMANDHDEWIRGCYWLALAAAVTVAAFWPEPTQVITPSLPAPPAAEEAEQRARDA